MSQTETLNIPPNAANLFRYAARVWQTQPAVAIDMLSTFPGIKAQDIPAILAGTCDFDKLAKGIAQDTVKTPLTDAEKFATKQGFDYLSEDDVEERE